MLLLLPSAALKVLHLLLKAEVLLPLSVLPQNLKAAHYPRAALQRMQASPLAEALLFLNNPANP